MSAAGKRSKGPQYIMAWGMSRREMGACTDCGSVPINAKSEACEYTRSDLVEERIASAVEARVREAVNAAARSERSRIVSMLREGAMDIRHRDEPEAAAAALVEFADALDREFP